MCVKQNTVWQTLSTGFILAISYELWNLLQLPVLMKSEGICCVFSQGMLYAEIH